MKISYETLFSILEGLYSKNIIENPDLLSEFEESLFHAYDRGVSAVIETLKTCQSKGMVITDEDYSK